VGAQFFRDVLSVFADAALASAASNGRVAMVEKKASSMGASFLARSALSARP
jgi:hypothetical protein